MTQPTPEPRTWTPIDAVADAYVSTLAALDPITATYLGIAGHDGEMPDLSPDGRQAMTDAAAATLLELDAHAPVDATDTVTIAAMRERLGLEIELHEAKEHLADLNVIASPLQGLRDVFDLMPTDTTEAWENIASRLRGLPTSAEGWLECLRQGVGAGIVPAALQVTEGIKQADELADAGESFFTAYVAGAPAGVVPDTLRRELEQAAAGAREAYATIASTLRQEIAPAAPAADGVGRERYARWSRFFLGATVDLEETYAWGLEELARVIAEQEETAARIAGPGASVAEAVAALDADPARTLHSKDELQAWMQATADAAIAALDGVHFDIPTPVKRLDCKIAPTQNGGIYYTGPSEDWARPGAMWWSVPPDVTTFNTWREKTTVYHEGVPGHHLQIAQAIYERPQLNSWRAMGCWVSGHGEGWALYAERLMADLGFLDDAGDRLGMLDGQRMRAARVVLDIGVHLGLEAPAQWGGGTWDAAKAWEFLRANVNMPESFIRFELNRYLGWPGQAPSYKIGQRLWETARDEASAASVAKGEAFSLRDFHKRALALGALPLDVLRTALV